MNVRGDFLKLPHNTNTTALICKSRKENPQKLTQLSSKPVQECFFFLQGRTSISSTEEGPPNKKAYFISMKKGGQDEISRVISRHNIHVTVYLFILCDGVIVKAEL